MKIIWLLACIAFHGAFTSRFVVVAAEVRGVDPIFNRAPLAEKPFAELPLGAIQPRGWLRDELQRMAGGMTGNLDVWYPEVCGPRNAWLGGDGDTWERGPYWIDGLYPLAKLLGDPELEAKATKWVEWTLAHQREDGYIGPREIGKRTRPAPAGAQTIKPGDWWPRMVMLKILQQHYQATGDRRVIDCLDRYFRYQLQTLPEAPLYQPGNPKSGSWWAGRRGGDNLMSVLWFYSLTGHPYLLELADLISKQTIPVTDYFARGPDNHILYQRDRAPALVREGHDRDLHCVNIAQMMKTPVIRWQQDRDDRHLQAVQQAFYDLRVLHGQPHGLFGGDEGLHGHAPDRGSELCTAVEMMFSLEKMFEITGDPTYADRLERIAYNALPTQCTDDHRGRQYFQQTNQVQITFGHRDFFNDNGDRVVYGLIRGYPCCTCNLHQGWPKFTQHLWMASIDGGLAAVAYAPSVVTAEVGSAEAEDRKQVTLQMMSGYPFHEHGTIKITTADPVAFPLHLRIPGWATDAEVHVGQDVTRRKPQAGTIHVIERTWKDGDTVSFRFPMPLRSSHWYHNSKAIERGPLVFALDIEPQWTDVVEPRPEGVPDAAPHRGYLEARPKTRWNYALPGPLANRPEGNFELEVSEVIPANPWTRDAAPVRLTGTGVPLDDWTINRNSAANPPLSPVPPPGDAQLKKIRLIPYGATTLRIAVFPWLRREDVPVKLLYSSARASHTCPQDWLDAVRADQTPKSSVDTSIRRWTSWPQRGKSQWIEIDLSAKTQIRSFGIYWYDDDRGVRFPASWQLEMRRDGQWTQIPLEPGSAYTTQPDRLNTVVFASPVETDQIRILVTPIEDKCVGILSTKLNPASVPTSR